MPEQDETLAEGRYQLLEVIGSGGMATVYRALDERLQVTRAIKVLSSAFSGKPRIRARFEAEARAMAAHEGRLAEEARLEALRLEMAPLEAQASRAP